MHKVRKGVITVAGLGTRFLPATKAMPKEMLPVLDKPVVQYIVEEMAASGITEIIFVTSSQKRAIEDHFDRNFDLEEQLKKVDKLHHIQDLIELSKKVRFFYTRQSQPLGNGHALLCAREFIGDEPFAFSDGDSIIDAKTPVVKQVARVFNKVGASIIGVQRIEDKQAMTKYGNVYSKNSKLETRNSKLYRVEKIVEKPSIEKVSPHGLIIGGMRYIFTRDIWSFLEKQKQGRSGEIWVADAVNAMAQKKPLYAYEYEGQYFDTGDKISLLKTSLHFAMKDKETRHELHRLFKN
ncbi:MAG TPA: UTP--glucose-1-phosphate uridylyltransferase [Candidatus Magasanikbacteria bacterium]|nr:MAG: hypothetical protein A2479_01160 [Candidatus Magasanikbacteria bacterium RIFOXYC2_FULL_39_8]HAT04000.1 UTP--glucose-1-phosphate uridylyltransferase [Candidatus Magasanikbacteria bacterium]